MGPYLTEPLRTSRPPSGKAFNSANLFMETEALISKRPQSFFSFDPRRGIGETI